MNRRINAIDYAEKFIKTDQFESYVLDSLQDYSFDPITALKIMEFEADRTGIELVNLDMFELEEFFCLTAEGCSK
jgi:hypothetical protein